MNKNNPEIVIDWTDVSRELNNNGFTVIKNLLTPEQCDDLIRLYSVNEHFRKTISMERYRFGAGEYKYFSYPLPPVIQHQRESLYAPLSVIANDWMKKLAIEHSFPGTHEQLLQACRERNQDKPTPLILRYTQGGYNTVHQDLYGDVYFPFQVVFALSQVGSDYEGGELVLLQQNPRAQSKATVVQPNRGDAVLFTTNFRPVHGTRGYHRAVMRHGVSEIRSGTRYSLGIIFHDAS